MEERTDAFSLFFSTRPSCFFFVFSVLSFCFFLSLHVDSQAMFPFLRGLMLLRSGP